MDKNNDRGIIKIEEYNMGNPNMKRNEIVFKHIIQIIINPV